jgi:hypothetical protein
MKRGQPLLAWWSCVAAFSCGRGIPDTQDANANANAEVATAGSLALAHDGGVEATFDIGLAGFSGTPTGCGLADLAAKLQSSPDAIDCGDLPLDASRAVQDAAFECARGALANMHPFQLFWRLTGTDSLVHMGVIARLEHGELRGFGLDLDEDEFGVNFTGATAAWWTCTPSLVSGCDGSPMSCLQCLASTPQSCGCLPRGERPGAPVGQTVEVICGGSQ